MLARRVARRRRARRRRLEPAGRLDRDLRRRQPGRCGAGDRRGAARRGGMGHCPRRRQRRNRTFAETVHPELRKAPKKRRRSPKLSRSTRRDRRWKPPARKPRRSAKWSPGSSGWADRAGPAPRGAERAAVARRADRASPGESPGSVPLGMRPIGRNRLGRGRAARRPDRPVDAIAGEWRRGGGRQRGRARLRAARPFRDASFSIAGDGAMSGEWMISGVPAFEPADGRFAGYRGIARREASRCRRRRAGARRPSRDPASLRELVHEIKTPLNAIIGFAEIIDGQYLGPADRRIASAPRKSSARRGSCSRRSTTWISRPSCNRAAPAPAGNRFRPKSAAADRGICRAAHRARRRHFDPAWKGDISSLRARSRTCRAPRPPLYRKRPRRRWTVGNPRARFGSEMDVRAPSPARGSGCHRGTIVRPGIPLSPDDSAASVSALRLVRGLARIAGGDLTIDPERLVLLLPARRKPDHTTRRPLETFGLSRLACLRMRAVIATSP